MKPKIPQKPGTILKRHFVQEVADVEQEMGLPISAVGSSVSWPRKMILPALSAAAVAVFVLGSAFFGRTDSVLSTAFATADERRHISISIKDTLVAAGYYFSQDRK